MKPLKKTFFAVFLMTVLLIVSTGCGPKTIEHRIITSDPINISSKIDYGDLNNSMGEMNINGLITKYVEEESGLSLDWPKEMPKEAPPFKHGRIVTVSSLEPGLGDTIVIEIVDASKNAFALYTEELKNAGWEIDMTVASNVIIATKGSHSINFSISEDDPSIAMIVYDLY